MLDFVARILRDLADRLPDERRPRHRGRLGIVVKARREHWDRDRSRQNHASRANRKVPSTAGGETLSRAGPPESAQAGDRDRAQLSPHSPDEAVILNGFAAVMG